MLLLGQQRAKTITWALSLYRRARKFWDRRNQPLICWRLLLLAACVLNSGCRSSNSRTIAVIPRTTATELWESVHKGAEEAGRQNGYLVYWNAPSREDDIEKQIEMVEKVIDGRPAGLVLAPDHYLALVGPVRRAMSRRIPTVLISSPLSIPAGQGLSYILNDEREMGRLAAMRIGMLLKGKGTVGIVGIETNLMSNIVRARSFETELRRNFPQISIVARETGSSNIAELQHVTRQMLMTNPHLDALLSLDAVATNGSLSALRAMRKTGSLKLIGFDQDMDLMLFLRQGEIDSIVVQNSNEMGALAVRWIAAKARGESVPDKVEITPVLVNKNNIDTPEVQRLLSANWRPSR